MIHNALVNTTVAFCTAMMLLLGPVARADWQGGIEGGSVLDDSGAATRIRLRAENNDRPLSQYIYVDWLRRNDSGNSYALGYRPRYWFSDQFYGFADGRYRIDKPLQIDRETQLASGAGYRFVSTKQTSIWAEAGLGFSDTRFADDSETDETFSLARGGIRQIISDLLRLEFDGTLTNGEDISELITEVGVSLRIPSGAVKYSYRVRQVEIDGVELDDEKDSFVSFTYGF